MRGGRWGAKSASQSTSTPWQWAVGEGGEEALGAALVAAQGGDRRRPSPPRTAAVSSTAIVRTGWGLASTKALEAVGDQGSGGLLEADRLAQVAVPVGGVELGPVERASPVTVE